MGRPASCACDTCKKCLRRIYMNAYYRRHRDTMCETARRVRARHLEKIRERDRKRGYRPRDPEKTLARQAVTNAIARGALVRQPCEVCGETQVDGHHDDYSRPLDVRWLCRRHHGEVHRMDFSSF